MENDYQTYVDTARHLLDAADALPSKAIDGKKVAVAAAHVYATLALAEATRANRVITVREDRP
jgi:hypothetical protein